jgi:phenylalanyl-tRNA synthetase beta chain
MRFSESWLREWVNPACSTDELVAKLTMAGLEVDAVEPAAPEFSGVVVAEITGCEPHPDADKLRICQVNKGDETVQIVCGAANARTGIKVPLATVGAVLPTADGSFKIKKAKLRGVESFGMLCAAPELGMAESADGLWEFPADAPVGDDVRDFLALNDSVIEVDLTPNRGDCLGIAGLARETGVLTQTDVTAPAMAAIDAASQASFDVVVDDASDCPIYVGRVIEGVNPQAESPLWMQERLRRSGIRSLGLFVDVTNYVLLELGQPMHAFDLAKLDGQIQVRRANTGEQLTLLDDSEIKLDSECLVIADNSGPLALAGVMGGANTGVTDDTVNIFLESACFNPITIAGRARRFGLHTDSSHRFERGVEPGLQTQAIERATALILEYAGGKAGPVQVQGQLQARDAITLRRNRVEQVLGLAVSDDVVEESLQRLGMTVTATENGWSVLPPQARYDITLEVDLIEEIARIVGYDNIPAAEGFAASLAAEAPENQLKDSDLRDHLVTRDYFEAVTWSFVEPEFQSALFPDENAKMLANPISADMAAMRVSLLPGLLRTVAHNANRQAARVRLFETGLRFVERDGGLQQRRTLAGAAWGLAQEEQWTAEARAVDFYDIKADLAGLLGLLDADIEWRAANVHLLHPGQSAEVLANGETVGFVGVLHPSLLKACKLKKAPVVFEFDLDRLEALRRVPSFTEVPRFPEVRRDLAVVVPQSTSAASLQAAVANACGDLLANSWVFDVYTGEGIDSGFKSVALAFVLQDKNATLVDEKVEATVTKVIAALTEIGATVRD